MLLAYDTTKLDPSKAPKTWADLVAWIKANPGQFIYNRPDKGGSGGNFVRRAIYAANGNDPSLFTVDNYTQAKGDEVLGKAWELLNDLAPSLDGPGRLHLGQHPVDPAPVAGRRHHDPGLVGPGAVGDRPGRAAGNAPAWCSSATSASRATSPTSPCRRNAANKDARAQARRLHPVARRCSPP